MRSGSLRPAGLALALLTCLFSCNTPGPTTERAEEKEAGSDFSGASSYEYDLLKDPRTGKIPTGIRKMELQQARTILRRQKNQRQNSFLSFTQQGPTNIGGRTRSVVFDLRYNGSTNKVILAGGVSGGLFKSTDGGATWVRKSSPDAVYTVSSIAQDPRPGHQNIWYYGTGEAFTGDFISMEPYEGDGLFKSTDNGDTWTKLPSSNTGEFGTIDRPEDFINKVVVNPVNGQVYMAVMGNIYKSYDEGNSWFLAFSGDWPFDRIVTDIVVSPSGRLYAGFNSLSSSFAGVWTSTSGDGGSWTRIGAPDLGWNEVDWWGRIVLALAPSDENILYAWLQTTSNVCPGVDGRLFRWSETSHSWSDLSANLPGCGGEEGLSAVSTQNGYDMVLSVKPDDANTVFLGGVGLYRSTDGFSSSDGVSSVFGNELHPDHHCLAFQPGNPSVMIAANDGGMQITHNNQEPVVSWSDLNRNYTTTQFYYVAIDPKTGSNKVIGGSQDNGTLRNTNATGSEFEQLCSGDGVSVGISQSSGNNVYEYGGFQEGNIFRRNASSPPGTIEDIRPLTANNSGLFVTLFHLDPDNTEYLYYANRNLLYRNNTASIATKFNWSNFYAFNYVMDPAASLTAMATTRGSYLTNRSSLFVGNNAGQVFRIDNPAQSDPGAMPIDISGSQFRGYVSSIAVNPRNDDTVLVCFSSYNVSSIWWTGNAHDPHPRWFNVEQNLTIPSVRSAAIVLTPDGVKYFVGTSVGLYRSDDPLSLDWSQEGAEQIGNAVVSSLALRPVDNRLLVGTYGTGMWTTSLPSLYSVPLPLTLLSFDASSYHEHALLNWRTESETNSLGFEVQRSDDGSSFVALGFISSHGSGSYRYEDETPFFNKVYYRLKMMDLDKKFRYSEVVTLRNDNGQGKISVTNPFRGELEIRLDRADGEKIHCSLFDANGKLVMQKEVTASNHLLLPSPSLNSGTYLLRLEGKNIHYNTKLQKIQ
ncbi:MAG: T9SS type A sorting domain-containing protein [Flavisolibacter sp.]